MAVVHDHVVRFRDHKLSSWTGLKQPGSSVTIGQHSDPLKHFRSAHRLLRPCVSALGRSQWLSCRPLTLPQLIIIGLGPLPPARATSAHILLASGLEKHDPEVSAGELNSLRTVQAMSTVIAHHPIQNLVTTFPVKSSCKSRLTYKLLKQVR